MAQIILVGGYGAVGRALAAELHQRGHSVIIAGRRLAAAQVAAAELGAEARHFDITDATTWDAATAGADLAVMCVDAPDGTFAQYLFAHGIHYADLSADDAHLRRIEALPPPTRSAALLSVGLAPGLSNLMAMRVAATAPQPGKLHIGLLFGINDHHGDAALAWTIDTFLAQRELSSTILDWGKRWGRRRMHAVGFGDQYALMRTGPALDVTTHVGFDSRLVTAALFAFARLARRLPGLRRLAPLLFRPTGLGTDIVGILVSPATGGPGLRFLAHGETRTTAALAALMLDRFLASGVRTGTWHGHQVLDADEIIAEIRRAGIGAID